MKAGKFLKQLVSVPLWVPKKLLLTPLEKSMNKALQLALQSTLKKMLRTVLAVAGTAALAAIPAMVDVFKNAAQSGSLLEQALFGAIVTGLVGVMAFVERFVSVQKNG